jgi:hypothetical protein
MAEGKLSSDSRTCNSAAAEFLAPFTQGPVRAKLNTDLFTGAANLWDGKWEARDSVR